MRNWINTFNILVTLLLVACTSNESTEDNPNVKFPPAGENTWSINKKEIRGRTQGTTFVVKTSEDSLRATPVEIENLLLSFDRELSGYIDTSELSKLNNSDSLYTLEYNNFFTNCYELSQEVFQITNGAFDPSVFPLVKAWGFFKDENAVPTKNEIDSILKFIGFEKNKLHSFDGLAFVKNDSRYELDFNAIAQGQSVDVIASFLKERGQEHFFIEVGGELVVRGLNNDGVPWIIGVDLPSDENTGTGSRNLENYLSMDHGGLATSGNYRKFYTKNNKRYSHTLDPKTGYPVEHHLLSATVIAPNAALADAYATAFMTMGKDKTMQFLEENSSLGLEVYLLFDNDQGRLERAFTPGMREYFLEE